MKNLYIIPFIFFGFITQAQIVNIPDANFKNALVNTNCVDTNGDGNADSNADLNNDGEIQVSEAIAVLRLHVGWQEISSLEGIEHFTNLIKLQCGNNQLNNINVSQNSNLERLFIPGNQLTSINVSQNSYLKTFNCDQNLLNSLDVTQNPLLERLSCDSNLLTSLDISQNSLLDNLTCQNNKLTNLDLTNNPNLFGLHVTNNLLTNLDLSQNPILRVLQCENNLLSYLDLSQNPNLEYLICARNNQLTTLNIKNGNNHGMHLMDAIWNPNLTCIQVDDINYANNQTCDPDVPTWCKPEGANYSEDCNLGTQNMSQQSYTIYPNPAQNILNIKSKEPVDSVRIYSINGSLIKESSSSSIAVSDLLSGLYFIQVNVSGNSVIKKFIKD